MGLGTNHFANTSSSVQEFIPELWSDDVIAAYKANLVLGGLVSKINHVGKRGDTIHIPVPTRGSANSKTVGSQVTLNQDNSSEIQVVIDKWFEYSIMIEDIIAVQALPSLRRFHTDDAGYALATRIDRDLFLLAAGLQGGSIAGATNLFETGVIGSDGSTAFAGSSANGTALTDAGLRKTLQTLDDADVPFTGRSLVIPPVAKNVLMGLSRFTEQAFVGEAGMSNTIRNGKLGDVYGVEIFVSSACPWIHVNSVTSTQSVTFTSTAPTGTSFADEFGLTVDWDTTSPTDTKFRACLLLHKDAFVFAEQQSVRSQTQYKQEYLGNLFTADTIYGVKELRDTAGISIIIPA